MRFELFPKHHTRYFHFKYLLSALRKVEGKVLDVGCGWGRISAQLKRVRPDLEVVGCDNNADYIGLCKEKHKKVGIDWIHCDAHKLTFKKNQFNAVYMVDVLEHLERPEEAISEGGRVLKRGGVFHLVVPLEAELTNIDGLIKRILRKNLKKAPIGHIQQFSLIEIKTMLKKQGFKVRKIRYTYYFFYQLISFCYYLYVSAFKKGEYVALKSENRMLNRVLLLVTIFVGYLVFIENKLMFSFKGHTAHITAILEK